MRIDENTRWWQDPGMWVGLLFPTACIVYAWIRFGPWRLSTGK